MEEPKKACNYVRQPSVHAGKRVKLEAEISQTCYCTTN
jgi:hypothetical protein